MLIEISHLLHLHYLYLDPRLRLPYRLVVLVDVVLGEMAAVTFILRPSFGFFFLGGFSSDSMVHSALEPFTPQVL